MFLFLLNDDEGSSLVFERFVVIYALPTITCLALEQRKYYYTVGAVVIIALGIDVYSCVYTKCSVHEHKIKTS